MADKVFRGYDQAALDAEYDNRAKVADAASHIERYTADSAAARQNLPAQLDLAYGPGDDEGLDVFPAGPGAPVQVFFHGGYWQMLSKDDFSYVARAFQPRGIATAVVEYSLIPTVDMDELVRQCRAAVAWTWRNAQSFGGDRERLFISGHSAGGHLVAMLMATDWPAFDGLPVDTIKGGCGLSGLYDLEPIRLCYLNEVLRLTPDQVARNSPLALPPGGCGDLSLLLGDREGPEYQRQSDDLAAAWRRQGATVATAALAGQDHFSIVAQLNDPEAEVSRHIQAQMGA
ncbi:MAG: alpha/beta hydrolase [Alphaproteobacteria bacterium]|jgi:arylformamidase|nr:alpha/beta hydrolase [Alphaproteobacteria bacterium]MDP6565055.1 alpha/beta hydrolase [Alphaproteobacteria bacterium]MDP6815055.1 alpha/beta hydrolase [Alphaproteobacteria bacterium]